MGGKLRLYGCVYSGMRASVELNGASELRAMYLRCGRDDMAVTDGA